MMKYMGVMVIIIALTACSQSVDDKVDAQQMYAMRPTQYTWPPLQPGAVISNNVLAKNYYLIIDGSGSMLKAECSDGKAKIDVAKTAIQQFVSQIPVTSNVGLLIFDNTGITEKVSLGLNREKILSDIDGIKAGDGTPLHASIEYGYKSLTTQAQSQLGYGEYHLVIVTDGAASTGQDPSDVVEEILVNSPVVLHTIGFCIGEGHSLNVQGKTDYRAANNPAELRKGLADVLAETPEFSIDKFK